MESMNLNRTCEINLYFKNAHSQGISNYSATFKITVGNLLVEISNGAD